MQLYPECVDQGSAATCLATLKAICETDPTRFPNLDTGCSSLHAVVETTRDINSPNYNYVGIIPDPTGTYAVASASGSAARSSASVRSPAPAPSSMTACEASGAAMVGATISVACAARSSDSVSGR